MKKTRAIVTITSIALCAVMLLTAISAFAWFALNNFIDPNLEKSTIVTSYFHTGRGTEEDPFVITRPIHFYNLVELYQRKDGFAESGYYFQLGYDLSGNGELLFYNYNDSGEQIETPGEEYSYELNMQYYSGGNALLPIGTSDVPFDATFDGSGLTVKNLYIKARETVGGNTFGTADVGIWGYVGPGAEIKDVYFNNVTLDLSDTDLSRTTEGHSTDVHDTDGDSDADTVYVGYIAGHIFIQSSVTDVYVNNCTVVGGDAAFSGYGYFGYVERLDGELVETLGSQIATLRAAGDDAGFGGSIDMMKLHSRLWDIWYNTAGEAAGDAAAEQSTYVVGETVTIDEVANTTSVVSSLSTMTFATDSNINFRYRYYASEKAGKYFYYNRTDMTNYNFMCMYGEGSRYPKTITTYTYKDEFSDAWYIYDGANYLSVTGTAVTSANSEAAAAKWQFDDSGHIYTMIETDDEFTVYYLNRSGTSGVVLNTNPSSVWRHSAIGGDTNLTELYTVYNTVNYYLDYDGGWRITPYYTYYRISDGQGNYLSGGNGAVYNAASADASVKWYFSDSVGSTTTISAYINGTVYYLYCDGTLSMQTTPTTWIKDGDRYYVTLQGLDHYLVFDTFDSTWKALPESGKKITDGNGHYLTASSTGVSNADFAGSVVWQFSSDSGNTEIYTVLSGRKYYLSYNNGLTVSTTSFEWKRSGNSFYTTSGNNDYYLTYANGWIATELHYYIIGDGAGNYLRVTGQNAFANGNENTATHFYFANQNGAGSSGRVYCIVDGNTYYLYNNNGTLATTTAQATGTVWQNDGGSLYITSGTTTYALQYASGWSIKAIIGGKVITDGNGNYLRVTGTGNSDFTNTTDIDLASRFTFSNSTNNSGYISTTVNGTTVYLRSNNNGNLRITSSTNNRTNWSNDNTRIYSGNYRLGFYGNTWRLTSSTSVTNTAYTIGYNGHYLSVDASGNIYDTTNRDEATLWSGNSGNIYAMVGGNTYYLAINGTSGLRINSTGTNWNGNSNRLRYSSGGTYYYVSYYNNNWTVRNNTDYAATTAQQTQTVTIVSRAQEAVTTRPMVRVTEVLGAAPVVTITDHTTTGTELIVTGPQNEQLTLEKTTYQTVTKEVVTERGGYQTYFPLRTAVSGDDDYDSNDPYKVSSKNTGYIISAANSEDNESTELQKLAGDIRISYFPIQGNITNSYNNSSTLSVTKIGYDGNYLILNKSGDGYTIGNTTDAGKADFWYYEESKLFTVKGGKIYFLTYDNGLAISESAGVNWTYNNRTLRYGSYTTTYIRYNNGYWTTGNSQTLSLTLGALTTVYTVDGNGSHALTDAQKTDVYVQASKQLLQTLNGSSSVYGLHFMDSEISADRLVTADYASVFGKEYYNYEMPEDSIDFNVIERGTISFFAGTYFTNNNTFFSLHQVIRYTSEDEEVQNGTKKVADIKYIKELSEIYQHSQQGGKVNYIYKFTDGTYTNADGTYTGATTLNEDYSSTPVFRLAWITNPGVGQDNRIYYFEIPCNAGEYCLGSVSGKTGAYLIYLDIAANGGDTLATAISSVGNDIVEAFDVEFRDRADTVNHSILQFSVEAPTVANSSDYSVNVTFDPDANDTPYTSGLYTINIVNKSSDDLELYVYLCDDDFDVTTPFTFAYSVIYTNNTYTGKVFTTNYGDTFQVMAGILIPSAGEAVEVSYH